jgi:hypothetical protein
MFSHLKSEHSKAKNSIRSIVLSAMLLTILVVQEQLLSGLPNIQITAILILIYAEFLKDREIYPMIVAYVILDNLIVGSLSIMYTPPMLIAWLLLVFVTKLLKDKPIYVKFIMIVLFGFVYGWVYLPFTAIVQKFNLTQIITYLKYDLVFEALMAASNAAGFLILYEPLTRLFKMYYRQSDEMIF